MTAPQTLIALILVQQGVLGLVWLGMAWLGLARQPAWHWGAAAVCMAASLGLVALRETGIGPWLGFGVANLLGFIGYAALRRGIQLFCERPLTDRAQAAAVLGGAGALALAIGLDAPLAVWAAITSTTLAWMLGSSAYDAWRGLRQEFGRRAVLWCTVPLALGAVLYGLRAPLALLWAEQAGRPVIAGGAFNAVLGLMLLALSLLMHLGLGAMVVLRTVQQLRRQSDRDALTGLLNRRGLSALYLRLFGSPPRHEGYALLQVDVDHFKQVNDRHGHEAGDLALIAVAQTLLAVVRPLDAVARTGGEEFCVLLPDVDAETSLAVAERVRQALRDKPLLAGAVTLRLTCSVGVTVAESASEPLHEAVRRADQALYRAKALGRDRVVQWLPGDAGESAGTAAATLPGVVPL